MKNLQYLHQINQKETGDNIRDAIKSIEYTELEIAEYLGVTERTLQYWQRGERLPSLDNMFRLSKLSNISMEELIVSNEDVEDVENFANPELVLQELISESQKLDRQAFPIMHYFDRTYHIKTLEEFLLYYPLFDKQLLESFFQRIHGSIGFHNDYVNVQLEYLYKNISNTAKRNEIDCYVKKYLRYPRLHKIYDGTHSSVKKKKYILWEEQTNKKKQKRKED